MAGKIVKAKNQTNFVQMHNDIARSPLLSMKAKAMLLVLLSLPENWVIHIEQLTDYFKESRNTVRNAFKELQEKGFILSVDERDSKGRFKGMDYVVYSESQIYIELAPTSPENKGLHPYDKNPHTDNPHTEKRDAENRTLQINTVINKDETKKNNTKHTIHNSKNIFFDFSVDELDHRLSLNQTINRKDVTPQQHKELLALGYKLDKEQNYYY